MSSSENWFKPESIFIPPIQDPNIMVFENQVFKDITKLEKQHVNRKFNLTLQEYKALESLTTIKEADKVGGELW